MNTTICGVVYEFGDIIYGDLDPDGDFPAMFIGAVVECDGSTHLEREKHGPCLIAHYLTLDPEDPEDTLEPAHYDINDWRKEDGTKYA